MLDEGKSIADVARDLDLTESAFRDWVERARAERTHGKTGLTATEREELKQLRKQVRQLQMERDILKKATAFFAKESKQVKFALVDAEKAKYPVNALCGALGVSRAGYYAWRRRLPSRRAVDDSRLGVLVREAHERSRRTYGSPHVHAELRAHKVCVSRKRVIRLMQRDGLVARRKKRYRSTTMSEHDQPIAPNLLARQFEAEGPNQRWVGDTTTELVTGDGKLYLAAIVDLFSRFVVGWSLSAVNDRHLTLHALDMALRRRGPEPGLLHHSDRGCTYASEDYRRALEQRGITCSMSRRGNSHDNAAMESWFSTLKTELGERFASHGHSKAALFDFIEVFYN